MNEQNPTSVKLFRSSRRCVGLMTRLRYGGTVRTPNDPSLDPREALFRGYSGMALRS